MKRASPVLSLLVFLAASLPAAEQQAPPFAETIEVVEVLLDVLVTDRQGNLVLGLGADDFAVSEGGKPVELTGVTFYSNRELPGEASGASGAPPADRYFILFFHDARLTLPRLAGRQLEAARQAREWARASLQPNDLVAVASYDARLRLHLDFSNDPEHVARAIEEGARSQRSPPAAAPERAAPPRPSLAVNLPDEFEMGRESPTIYHGLRLVAEAAGAIRGRKNLLLFSTGFGELDLGGLYVPDRQYYDPLVRTLNDNNVTVFALDLFSGEEEHTFRSALRHLAADTSGELFYNFLNYRTALEKIARENNGYYLLSYRSGHPAGTSGYQRVEVKPKNPKLRVRARAGYLYGPP